MIYKGLKVGVFTITDAINYGAFYQMYGMARYMEDNGADVTVYHCGNSLRRQLIKYFSPNLGRQFRKLKLLYLYGKERKSIKVRKYKGERLDAAILGSDEIWNLQNPSFDRFEQYYGLGLNAKKIVAYAPSIGYASPDFLIENAHFASGVKNIDTVLARDAGTKLVAESILGYEVQEVADPTILFDDWSSVGVGLPSLNEGHVLYYGYTSTPPFKALLEEFCRAEGLDLVTAGHHMHDWCSINYKASPFDFLNLIRTSKYVFTSTFHGTVMASLLGKPLAYYATGQKVADYGSKLGMSDSHLGEGCTMEDLKRAISVDVSLRREKLDVLRDKSRVLLQDAVLG